jgi:predicted nucleic acid-binding protein
MKALFDTNILLDYEAGHQAAGEEIDRHEFLITSRIVWIEFLVGAKTSESAAKKMKFLERFVLLEVTKEIASETVSIRQRTRLKLPDAIILATARVHGLLLVTRNHRDFPRNEPDIRIPY